MPVDTFTETITQDLHETIRQLNSDLGPTLVAYLSASKDQKASLRWAKADGPLPRNADTRNRILAAHRAWGMLVTHHNEYTARNWFIAANPRLAEDSPVDRLREGDVKSVLYAVEAFVEGTFQ